MSKSSSMIAPPARIFDERILEGIPGGTWVAISFDQERVVGKGLSMDEAVLQARNTGEELPFVLRILEGKLASL